jgi:2-hydroxychromene-2-carboxylate isomerase
LMRGATALKMKSDARLTSYCYAVFKAMWVDARNMSDLAVVGEVLGQAGFDPAATLALANEQAVKDQLKAATQEAVARGVFGAPTFFVGEQMFWGQDRIDWVREALA